jgi:hypothetical protein
VNTAKFSSIRQHGLIPVTDNPTIFTGSSSGFPKTIDVSVFLYQENQKKYGRDLAV